MLFYHDILMFREYELRLRRFTLRPIELACELLSLPLSRVPMARHAVFPICS